MYILTETGGQTVTTALFIIAPNWSQPHCPSTGERINRQSLHPTDPLSFVVQLLSCVRLFAPPWTAACQASQSFTIGQSLLKLMSIELMMPTNHRILHHPLLLLPSIFPIIRVFSNESVLHIMWPEYWSFSFSISPSNEYSGLISFRMDWFELLAVQGTLQSSPTPQFKNIHSALKLIYGRNLTSIHDYWKNHSFESTHLCLQSDVSAF